MEIKKNILFGYIMIALGVLFFIQTLRAPDTTNVPYSQFKQLVRDKKIISVVISSNALKGYENVQPGSKERLFPDSVIVTPRVSDLKLVEFLEENGTEIIAENENSLLMTILSWVVPTLLFVGLWMFANKRMGGGQAGMMKLGKHKAKIIAQKNLTFTFDSVAGQEEAKVELNEVVDFLKNPDKYKEIGAKIPRGVLLTGPPGTGKTLFARAVAGEAKIPFFSIGGSDFLEMFVGVGAARVRDLFEQAKKNAPCIIFIDEIDAIGKSRAGGGNSGNDEREQTLNQLLVEMDGFDDSKGVIMLASTNRPDILDPALLRPGRFDRQVIINNPDKMARKAILELHLERVKTADNINSLSLAAKTAGFSGAELANVVNEASLMAVREDKKYITDDDLNKALEKLMTGIEKKDRSKALNDTDKKRISYHEIGHAMMSRLSPVPEQIHKISIVPRSKGALGFTFQLPEEDKFLYTENELLSKIDFLLGGRAAEEIIFNEVTTGAHNDLSRATELAQRMIASFGMNKKVGLASYQKQNSSFLAASSFQLDILSQDTARIIDEETRDLMAKRMDYVKKQLNNNLSILNKLAEKLIDKETLEREDFDKDLASIKKI